MIENKQSYIKAIMTTYKDIDTVNVIYKLLCDKRVKYNDIRDLAIALRFDELSKDLNTSRDTYDQLSAEFNCSYRLAQNAVLNRRSNKFNSKA